MKTVDEPSAPPRRPPSWGVMSGTVAALVLLPLLTWAVLSKWGVLVALAVAAVAGVAIWVRVRGLVAVELIGFLIHFDGVGFGPVRMGRVVAAATALYLIYRLVSGWRPPAVRVLHWAPVWALASWAVLSGLWSARPGGWFFTMGVFGLGLVFFCVGALLLEDHRTIERFLRSYWVGGLAGTALGILALFLGTRSVGFGGDPNFFGLLQASMIPLTAYYRRRAPTRLAQHGYSVVMVLVIAGAAGAGSRSGLIGSSLAIVATMVTKPGLSSVRRIWTGVAALGVAATAGVVSLLINPNTVSRGLHDRGAGRLDLWNVTEELIRDRPLWGHGLGQIQSIIPSRLLVTPGSQLLTDRREAISAHNTWMDVWGDLGVVGLSLLVAVFVIAVVSLVRPRWPETRELSTVLAVMMLPVLSGSVFLPLLNNKLAWVLIGTAAALQVPSAESRWRHLVVRTREQTASSDDLRELNPPGDGRTPLSDPVDLAKWDLAFPRRLLVVCVIVALLTGGVAAAWGANRPTVHTATAGLLLSNLDGDQQGEFVRTDVTRLQVALTMVLSGAYAEQLRSLSDVDLSVEEIRANLDATRVRMGFYVEVEYSDTDEDRVSAVAPHLLTALDEVYSGTQEFAALEAEDQRRPAIPGERLVYLGPAYLHAYDDVIRSEQPPRVLWFAFIGTLFGALASVGVVLSGQRRPRVSVDDRLDERLGLPTWARIGGRSGRRPSTGVQYEQVLTSARSRVPDDAELRRLVVTAPRVGRRAEDLAFGLACELADERRPVVLVDLRPPRSSRWAGPRPSRRQRALCRGRAEHLRVVRAGSTAGTRTGPPAMSELLEQFDESTAVVALVPQVGGPCGVADVLAWADAVLVEVVIGRTSTTELEECAASVKALGPDAGGVVLFRA